MKVGMAVFAGAATALAVVLSGCSGDEATSEETDTSAEFTPVAAKQWTVDTSGWWVPEDPTGCLTETTTCLMSAWYTRDYETGQLASNVFRHGDTLTLFCKAPSPASIRNPVKTENVYWYYAEQGGNYWWVPDVYVTKDDIEGMAEGVPDCPSNTPGIDGGPAPSPTAAAVEADPSTAS